MDKRYRLRKQGEFKLVRSEGRSQGHPLLVLYARPNQLALTRLGLSVGKRLGNAVVRNRVKRRLREMFRLMLTGVRPGFDVILIARKPAAGADYSALVAAFQHLLLRSGLCIESGAVAKGSRHLEIGRDLSGLPESGIEVGRK